MILQLPKPTTANERLWGKDVPVYWGQDVSLVRRLREHGWLVPEDEKFVYQPLFGLTAKDTTGKVRTVVQGDILLDIDAKVIGIVTVQDYGFYFKFYEAGTPYCLNLTNCRFTILCHATDIVAAGNKLTCWECHGSGRVVSCPTCHGEGTFNIVWKE